MDFTVTILGSASAVPTARRALTSQLVSCSNRYFLIDCGEGTQMQLRLYKQKFQRIDHILISHLHGDHYFGLVGLLSTMHLMGRVKPITIYADSRLQGIIESQLNIDGNKLRFSIHFVPLKNGDSEILFEDDKVVVSHFPLKHKIPTSGFLIKEKQKEHKLVAEKAKTDGVKIEHYHRLKRGEDVELENGEVILSREYTEVTHIPRSYAFCSDTRFHKDLIPFIDGVDVLYHEATFTEQHKERAKSTMHSTAGEAGKIASMAKVGKLLMGHISARYDEIHQHELEAKEHFDNAEVVEDGKVYEIAASDIAY